jgi:predicted lysophospholipase L1 biosynthesis ABC-type transport system permease subunit
MRTLDAEIGDEVALARRDLLVVGQALLPGGLGFPSMTMDDGATVTAEGFERLGLEPEAGIVAVRFVPGPDGNKARAVAVERGGVDVADAPRPFDVDNLWRVRSVPWLLAALLATLTAIVIGHTILSVVRSRRIDFAVVKVFGFTRGQVVAVVAWQATTIVMLASIVGIPLGVAGGGWAWSLVADALGTTPERVVPYAALTILAVVGLVTANVVGAWPGGMAARRRPASALHAE